MDKQAEKAPVEQEALKYGADVFRGSLDDVLMRYIKACEKYGIERVVRITADCPDYFFCLKDIYSLVSL